MDQGRIHRHDVAELRVTGGTLLVGPSTDTEIMYWRNALGQDRLPALAGQQLRREEAAAPQLRRLAHRIGLMSHRPYMTDAVVGDAIRRAIDARQLAAVFLPDAPAPTTPFLQAGSSSASSVSGRFMFARATPVERVAEMLHRTPGYLAGDLKQIVLGMVSAGSIPGMSATLVTVAAGQALGYSEVVDATLPGFAFRTSGWSGLVATSGIIAATIDAATAARDADLDEAAQRFAGGLIVLGQAFWAFLQERRIVRGSDEEDMPDTKLLPRRLSQQRTQSLDREDNIDTEEVPQGLFSKLTAKVVNMIKSPSERLSSIANKVNPTNSTNNCGYIIDAVVGRFTGGDPDATAPNSLDGNWNDIEKRFKTSFSWHQGFDAAFKAVKASGNGTIALIGVNYNGGGAHVITIINDRGYVGIVEGQNWGGDQSAGVIDSVAAANARYNPDGKSNIGFAVLPNN